MTYLLILAIAGQLADVWTTRRFLQAGTPEGNPFGAFFIHRLGLPAVAAIKIVLVVTTVWADHYLRVVDEDLILLHEADPLIWPSLVVIGIGFGAAIYNEWKWRK